MNATHSLAALRFEEDAAWARLTSIRDALRLHGDRVRLARARLAIQARAFRDGAPFRAIAHDADSAPSLDVAALNDEETALMERAERVRRDLEAHGVSRSLPLLADVTIASPCEQRWVDMEGDEKVRHCAQCNEKVYNLSQMTAAEAEATLDRPAGESRLCLRLYRRKDGTVLTQDCPAESRRRLKVRIGYGVAGLGLVLAIGAVAFFELGERVKDAPTMGTRSSFE